MTSVQNADTVTVYDRFREFVDDNPQLIDCLIRLAEEWRDRFGLRKLGINGLVETARWHVAISTNDPDYKINNNFAPYLAREIATRRPDLAPLFEFRASRADRHYGIVRIADWPGCDTPVEGGLW